MSGMGEFDTGGPQDLFYARSETVPLPMIVRASGIYLWDDAGRKYIDVSSGPVVSNIGHGNERVAKAMAEQVRRVDYAYSRVARHQANIDVAEKICALAGPGYERVSLTCGGSEAMEVALKFLRQYALATGQPKKKRIITLQPSYHGGTISMLAISGDVAFGPFLEDFAVPAAHVPAPIQYRLPDGYDRAGYRRACADALEEKILELGAENVLAFVVEPVGGLATGAQPLEEDYANRVRRICDRHGVYLVYDEILCGSGRTGRFLASQAWPQARGDVAVLAKGLAAGYAPLGATLFPVRMVDQLSELTGFAFSHTYSANPVSCAAGLAALEMVEEEGLIARAASRGDYLKAGLLTLGDKYPCIGDVRGRGLLMAVEVVADRETKNPFPDAYPAIDRLRTLALEHGLMIYSRRTSAGRYGDWFVVAPPLVISEPECDDLLSRLDRTMADFERDAAPHDAKIQRG